MQITLKCPNCGTGMEKGFISADSFSWLPQNSFPGNLKSLAFSIATLGYPKLYAYRCPKCGKVELVTEVEPVKNYENKNKD